MNQNKMKTINTLSNKYNWNALIYVFCISEIHIESKVMKTLNTPRALPKVREWTANNQVEKVS